MIISVILSNYNGARYLEDAIRSVLEQGYDDYEFIIVDDGSGDDSPDIIRRFADSYPEKIIAVLEPENRGQAAGFNLAVARASGDIVAFIDSDDLWMPGKLANLAAFIALAGPAALYQHNLLFMEGDTKTDMPYHTLMVTGNLYEETCATRRLPTVFAPTSGLAFPRSILEKVMPVPEAFRTCADGYLTRTVYCHGTVASINTAWGYYRVHEFNSVYKNPAHNQGHYRNKTLVPMLNRYYASIGAELRLPVFDVWHIKDAVWIMAHYSLYEIFSSLYKWYKRTFSEKNIKVMAKK
ncbi:MAG TPA: glycosyltransferase [Candidatus Hydrogenedentes bacterium]|nr:glycosyltransferase [Candidatus Hydrogenedentota bacterium]